MVEKEKVILMTKLAIKDKNTMKEDRMITSYYIEDYIYMNNFWSRISVLVVVAIIAVIDVLWQIERGGEIPLTFSGLMEKFGLPYLGVFVISASIFTIISSIAYRKRYIAAEKRIKEYDQILKTLNKGDELEEEEVDDFDRENIND
ncbi:MAG: hypothetical protein ATN36_02665 [Epulopiscium sp. Nele67-Bin005]|nr:MAG: hypothetical protein ATN36_02665 [Epulopiscium sp. Nele67-Bin005]